MSTARDYEHLIDEAATQIARESAGELSRLLQAHPGVEQARVKLDGTDLILPRQALSLLRDILSDMAQGKAVAVVPQHAELTTQLAAKVLNVSRPHLVGLLESGALPFTRVGTHRRVRFEDVTAYKAKMRAQSEAAMQELADLSQAQDMGY